MVDLSPILLLTRNQAASLRLYSPTSSNARILDLTAYTLLRDWNSTANWYEASYTRAWDTPGARAATDRSQVAAGRTPLTSTLGYASLDVTSEVQHWLLSSGTNGFMLVGSGSNQMEYQFLPADWQSVPYRPTLLITLEPG